MNVLAWLGLVVSWLLLALVLKFVILVLRVLKDIRLLAQMTRDTAVLLADHVCDDETFAQLELLARQLPDAVRGLPAAAAAVSPPVSSVSPGLGGRRS